MYYKVLVNGKSCHGGNMKWDLPKNGKPGKWHHVKGNIERCAKGLHLTEKPYEWFMWGCDIYQAEGKGTSDGDASKTAFESARLIKKIAKPDWLKRVETFVESIKSVKWFSGGTLPKSKKIKMFETRDAALDSALDAARAAARAAARDSALDAALLAQCIVAEMKGKHMKYAELRWSIWEAGYGVLCDVNGRLYCYRKP